jgi:integrase
LVSAAARQAPRRRNENEKTFREASDQLYLREYDIITQGQRSKTYVAGPARAISRPPGPVLRPWAFRKSPPARFRSTGFTASKKHGQARQAAGHNTMHQEIVTLRQILKTALRHGWLDHLPDLSEPYRSSPKISHRAWFSPEEYKQLYEATRKRAHEPKQPRFKWECEQLHDYVLFSANTGLRPDEARRFSFGT